jgi:hypothetical protein
MFLFRLQISWSIIIIITEWVTDVDTRVVELELEEQQNSSDEEQ